MWGIFVIFQNLTCQGIAQKKKKKAIGLCTSPRLLTFDPDLLTRSRMHRSFKNNVNRPVDKCDGHLYLYLLVYIPPVISYVSEKNCFQFKAPVIKLCRSYK